MTETEELRSRLAAIRAAWGRELRNIPVTAPQPDLERVIIALTFANGDRRIDALDRLLDNVLRLVSDTRKRLIACDEWTRDQARRAAANAA